MAATVHIHIVPVLLGQTACHYLMDCPRCGERWSTGIYHNLRQWPAGTCVVARCGGCNARFVTMDTVCDTPDDAALDAEAFSRSVMGWTEEEPDYEPTDWQAEVVVATMPITEET